MIKQQKILTLWIKKIFSDTHNAIVALIVSGVVAAVATNIHTLKILWPEIKKTILSGTPLWATIAIILLLGVFFEIRIRNNSFRSCHKKKLKPFYVTTDQYKWKVCDNSFGQYIVLMPPYCKKHDIRLIETNNSYHPYQCPYNEDKTSPCNINDSKRDIDLLYKKAKSIADKEIRKKDENIII